VIGQWALCLAIQAYLTAIPARSTPSPFLRCRAPSLSDLPADLLFEPDEWRAAFILNKKPVPKQTPTLNTVVRLIAQRGGFLGRKHDGEPGAKTIWLGMREIAVFVEGARYARQFNDG
jgi:hypothetical protein